MSLFVQRSVKETGLSCSAQQDETLTEVHWFVWLFVDLYRCWTEQERSSVVLKSVTVSQSVRHFHFSLFLPQLEVGLQPRVVLCFVVFLQSAPLSELEVQALSARLKNPWEICW